MSIRVNGLTSFTPGSSDTTLIATTNGSVMRWTGSGAATAFALASGSLSTTGNHRMVQANDVIYGTDKVGAVFKFDGTTLTRPSILAADGVTPMDAVQDLIWMFNRLWFARGDFIYWTDLSGTTVYPETIVDAPLRIRAGGGDTIVRLVQHRNGYIIVFKRGTSGNGSISIVDATANDPDYFTIYPLVNNISIISPDAIVKAGTDPDADILFPTREGFRSLRITSLDKITTPSLPFSENIKPLVDSYNYNNHQNAWAIVFEEELLWFVPSSGQSLPDKTLAWSFREPQRKESIAQGWTELDLMPGTCGAVASLAGARPQLWLGTATNKIVPAFDAIGTQTYRETSKRITFDDTTKDKRLLKLMYVFDRGGSGSVTPKIQNERGDIYTLETRTLSGGGLVVPAVLPAILGATGIDTKTWDLRYDSAGTPIPRFQDIRVWLESTGDPKILGFKVLAQIEKERFTPLRDEQDGGTLTAATVGGDTLTASAITME